MIILRSLIVALLTSLLFACVNNGKSNSTNSSEPSANSSDVSQGDEVVGPDVTPVLTELKGVEAGEEVRKRYGSIPVEVNKPVMKWLNYYQGRGRKYMERYLERSSRYMPLMKQKLREEGLPEDLIYVVFIESGFSFSAHSRANAVGYWQFIRSTGKIFGLKIDPYVDERRDPVLSTDAAAQYFKTLHNRLGDWYLALAAYNCGERRVERLVRQHGTKDFWEIAKKRRFPKETANYVPKFLAALIIAKNPEQYGFTNIQYEPPLDYDAIKVGKPIDLNKLAAGLNATPEEIKRLNPRYRTDYVPIYRNDQVVRIPKGRLNLAYAALNGSFAEKPAKIETDEIYYKIRKGDTLSRIAHKHHTTVSAIRSANNLTNKTLLRVGRTIMVQDRGPKGPTEESLSPRGQREDVKAVVPTPPSPTATPDSTSVVQDNARLPSQSDNEAVDTKSTTTAAANAAADEKLETVLQKATPADLPKFHIVRRGENLTTIAQKYGVTVSSLKKLNNLGRRGIVRIKQKLRIFPSESSVKRFAKRWHVVRRGENLTQIARKYKVTIYDILRVNSLPRKSHVTVGKQLMIPIARTN